MTETKSLTDTALDRLRKLGEGNGLTADSLQLIDKNEAVYTLRAHIRLVPKFDTQARSYPGPAKGKNLRTQPTFAAMEAEAAKLKQAFLESKDWLSAAQKEIQDTPGHGWGLDGAKVTLPGQSYTLAATENCPTCRGNQLVTCTQCFGERYVVCVQCHGKGQEVCYNCFGRGEDPVNPQQPCPICRGTRLAPCRYCQATGKLPCPTCQAKGGTPCPQCQGTGRLTQEIVVDGHAEVEFRLGEGKDLPSGLLRAIERLGIDKMANGHADIALLPPDPNEPQPNPHLQSLSASLPYAEMKLRILGRAALVSSFGKKGLMSGLPAFLDESLRPWREHLARAAKGTEPLDKALEARALREALALELEGKGDPKALRRLYPIGLSPDAAKDILRQTSLAVRHITVLARGTAAALSVMCAAGLFAALFLTPWRAQLVQMVESSNLIAAFDLLLPLGVLGLSWFGLTHATRWTLRRRYPRTNVALGQKIGWIGYSALTVILLSYAVVLAMAPAKPAWLLRLLG